MAAAAADSTGTVVGTRCRRAKRARTDLADKPDALSDWRDWANLTAGPAVLIAERILADDVASYLRFRAVCVPWRRSAPSPHAHDVFDRRFHPRRWIMLPEVFATRSDRRDFLNVSTGERIRVDLPGQFVFGHTSGGLILLCQDDNGAAARLFNPLTRQLTNLPNATPLLRSLNHGWASSTAGLSKFKELLQPFSAGLTDGSTLALHFRYHELAVAKPNVERWRYHALTSSSSDYIISALWFADRFYCLTRKGIMVVDITCSVGQQPQLVLAVKVDQDFVWADQHWNLVDNDGEMILVRRRYGANFHGNYEVDLVDLGAGKMVPVLGLRGRALFICQSTAGGRGRAALSVHAGLSSSISADTVYECREIGDCRPRIDAYDLRLEDWIKQDFCARRGSIVDYLSRYVCRSENIVVPAPPLSDHSVEAAVAGPRKRKANPKVTGNEWVN